MSKRNILIVTYALLLSNAMSGLDGTIVNTALPAIISDLHGLQLMAWIVAVFLLGTAVSTVIWSKLGERVGNKKAYQLAAVFFVVGSLLQGLAPNIVFLIVSRAIAGIGNGGMVSLPYIIYAQLYKDPRKRMKTLALVSGSYSFATIIGPLVGGAIVDVFSWHWVFYLNVPIGLLSAILVQIYYTNDVPKATRDKIDYLGASLLTVGLVALLSGIEMIGTGSTALVVGLIVVAVILLGLLLVVEQHASDPIIPGRLFTNKALVADLVLFTLVWGAFMGFLIYSPMWAQGLLGTSALIGGATQIPSSFMNFAGSESVPELRRKLNPHQVITLSIVVLTMTFVPLVFMGVHAPYWLLLVAGAFEGLGNGACFNELQIKVQQEVEPIDVSVATSFSFLIRILSQTFTTSIFGVIMNHALNRGVAASGGTITMKMMNKLSDAASVGSLPQHLIPQMRNILHAGLHNIMVLSLIMMLLALVVSWRVQHQAATRQVVAQ
ncbi:MFS transporter [Lacticaseibacillus sp. GG6-2]